MRNDHSHLVEKTPQGKAAKIAGFMFLFVLATYLISDTILSNLVVSGHAADTAKNIQAFELNFRIGTAIHLICSTSVIVLSLALFVVLKPVSRNLSLLGLLWRSGEAILGGIIAFSDFYVISLLSGTDYFAVFETDQVYALVRLFLQAHFNVITIAIVFSCMGATIFNYLLLKSKYIPRVLASWGIFASIVALIVAFISIISPSPLGIGWGYLPIFTYEILLAFWFLLKGLNPKYIKLQTKLD